MKHVCKDCGTVAESVTKAKGTMAVEIVLWLFFIVPGLIYSIWRLSNKYEACPACGSEKLLPVNSPVGQQMAASSGHTHEVVKPSATAVGIGRSLGRMVGSLKR